MKPGKINRGKAGNQLLSYKLLAYNTPALFPLSRLMLSKTATLYSV